MPGPALSVVLPVHNGARMLADALRSVVEQTFGDFELVAVDDGSTDGTADVLRDWERKDPRLRVVTHARKRGISAACNTGLEVARGSWIARMDHDDVAWPERFAVQMRQAGGRSDLAVLGTHARLIDARGRPIPVQVRLPRSHDDIHAMLLRGGWPVIHPTVLVRREAVVAAGGYDPRWDGCEDHDLFLRLAGRWRIENLPDVLLDYRLHAGSLTVGRYDSDGRFARLLADARQRWRADGRAMPDRRGGAPGLVLWPRSIRFELALARSFLAAPGDREGTVRALRVIASRWQRLARYRARRVLERLRRSDRRPDRP